MFQLNTYIRYYIYTYIHTYIRTYIYTYIYTYTNIYTYIYLISISPRRRIKHKYKYIIEIVVQHAIFNAQLTIPQYLKFKYTLPKYPE